MSLINSQNLTDENVKGVINLFHIEWENSNSFVSQNYKVYLLLAHFLASNQ